MKTSVKIKFRASTVSGKAGCVYYQVIHNRVSRQIRTDYRLFPSEWDKRSELVNVCPFHTDAGRAAVLQSIREHVQYDKERLDKIVSLLKEQNVD